MLSRESIPANRPQSEARRKFLKYTALSALSLSALSIIPTIISDKNCTDCDDEQNTLLDRAKAARSINNCQSNNRIDQTDLWTEEPILVKQIKLKSLEELGVLIKIDPIIQQARQKFSNLLSDKAEEIIQTRKLPRIGEAKLWVNHELPEIEIALNQYLTVITYNIHYGMLLDCVIDELLQLMANISGPIILALQEVDYKCIRSGLDQEIALEITKKLNLKYGSFMVHCVVIDKEDINEHIKDFPESIRGTNNLVGRGLGVMGQAIISNLPISNLEYLPLTDERFGFKTGLGLQRWELKEPVFGQRSAMKANITFGQQNINFITAHLEAAGGMRPHVEQFAQLADYLQDSKEPTILCGDFNTLNEYPLGTILRYAYETEDDFLKYKGEFQKESNFWKKYFFSENGGLSRTTLSNFPTILKEPFPATLEPVSSLKNGTVNAELWGPSKLQEGFRKKIIELVSTVGITLYSPVTDWILVQRDMFKKIPDPLLIGHFGASDHRPIGATVELI